MNTLVVSQLFLLLTAFALAALLWLMLLIARFYARFSSQATGHRWFIVPIILYSLAAIRYSSIDRSAGDPIADALLAIGGIMLAILSLRLHHQMTHHKRAT